MKLPYFNRLSEILGGVKCNISFSCTEYANANLYKIIYI